MISKQVWSNSFFVRLLFSAVSTFSLLSPVIGYPSLLLHNPRPASLSTAMGEKASSQDLPRENAASKSSTACPGASKSSVRGWILLLCTLLAGGWFLGPHYCHHLRTRVLTIEERVRHILSTTPLIGMIPDLMINSHIMPPNCEPLNVNHKLDRHSTADNF